MRIAYYREMVAGTFASPDYGRAERIIELARDWDNLNVTESGQTRSAKCIGWTGTGLPVAHWLCPS
jgi:hypothetical protein